MDALQAYIDHRNAQCNAAEWNAENTNPASTPEVPVSSICNMVVVGIVMDVQYCAFEGCSAALINTQGGVFCEAHELAYGDKCCIRGSEMVKVQGTQACIDVTGGYELESI